MGLVTMLSFGWIYFLISRFFAGKKESTYLMAAAIAGATLAAAFGIINRCGIDLFGMYQETFGGAEGAPVDPNTIARSAYLSTVGHRGWYSTYLIVILPVPLYLFWKGDKIWMRLTGAVSAFIISTAASASGAMAALLGLGGILIGFLFFSFQNKKLLLRYLELQLLVFTSMQTMHILMLCFPDKAISYGDGATQNLIESKLTVSFTKFQAVLLVAVLILVLVMEFRKKKRNGNPAVVKTANTLSNVSDPHASEISEQKDENKDKPDMEHLILRILRVFIFGVMVLLVAGLLTYVVLNSLGRLPEKYMSDSRLLKVNSAFEGFRWRIWSFSVTCFNEFCKTHPICRIFGVGPNCTYVLFSGDHTAEMQQLGQDAANNAEALLANAHSEWLTEFIDEGILGGIAYLGIFISVMVSCARRVLQAAKDTFWDYLPVLTAVSAFGYFCHDTVSYQQISAAPFMFVILGLGMQSGRYYSAA